MYIYLNDGFVPRQEAKISVFDHGLMYGDGVFETLRSYNGNIFRLDDHLDRLFSSAKLINLAIPQKKGDLKEILNQSLRVNRLKEAYIRISVTRGEGDIGLDPDLCKNPTIIVISKPFVPYQEGLYGEGISLIVSMVRRIPQEALDPAIKSLNFLNNIMARIDSKKEQAFDALMLNMRGCVTETTTANIFMARGGDIITPPSSAGILKGVTRSTVIYLSQGIGIKVSEEDLLPSDLYMADEVFLTSTSMEVMPVVMIDGKRVGDGRPGRITKRILQGFRSLVSQETGLQYR